MCLNLIGQSNLIDYKYKPKQPKVFPTLNLHGTHFLCTQNLLIVVSI